MSIIAFKFKFQTPQLYFDYILIDRLVWHVPTALESVPECQKDSDLRIIVKIADKCWYAAEKLAKGGFDLNEVKTLKG